jgi:hypothetical protein
MKKHPKEIDRYRQGISYSRTAINNHAIRLYQGKNNIVYFLNRNTSLLGSLGEQMECYYFQTELSTPVDIDFSNVKTWKQAESKLEHLF